MDIAQAEHTEILVLDVEDDLAELVRVRAWACSARTGIPKPGLADIIDDTSPDPARRREPTSTGGHGVALIEAFAITWGQDKGDGFKDRPGRTHPRGRHRVTNAALAVGTMSPGGERR